MTHAGFLAVFVTVLLAAGGTAAYSLAGRRDAASAHVPAPAPLGAVVLHAAVRPVTTYGVTVRVTGTVLDAAGRPLPGRVVELVAARQDLPSVTAVVGTPMSDGRGRVAATFRPAAGSTLWLRFPGALDLLPALSEPVSVEVGQRVTLTGTSRRARGGWTVTLRGTVRPARAGQRVRLDRRVGRSWQPVAVQRLSKAGAYAFTVRRTRPGTFRYRVVRPADAAFGAGTATYDLRLRAPRAPRLPSPSLSGNGGPGTLLVTGDSFAYFLGEQLTTARRPKATGVESRPSTGLARPDYYDWGARARAQVKAKPGAVVVFLGANDCQPIRTGGTGAWTTVGSDGWVAEYQRRAAALMTTYATGAVARGAASRPVYWVGLPIAERADITSCYRAMNAATRAAAGTVRGVTWVDSWSLYAVDGHYSEYVSGVLARQDDGIHLTFDGTRFLTRRVYALLR
jgi:lysophospholipase L1-like esterase